MPIFVWHCSSHAQNKDSAQKKPRPGFNSGARPAFVLEEEAPLHHNNASGDCRSLARTVGACWLIDVGRYAPKRVWVGRVTCRSSKVHMVECVVSLRTDLEGHRLMFVDILIEVQVDVRVVRTVEGIPRHVAVVGLRGATR